MDKQNAIILIVIILVIVSAILIYLFSGEKLSKRIRRGDIDSITVTQHRETKSFSSRSDINRFCAAAESIRLRRFSVKNNSVNGKIGGNFFITFKYKDSTALDLCFNGSFTACRIGAVDWYSVSNPKKAKRLELEF